MAERSEWDLEGDDAGERRRRAAPRAPVSPALVARVQNGSLTAFRELVRRFEDKVFAHALALSGDLAAARAASLAVFVQAHDEVRALTDARQVPGMFARLVRRRCPARDGVASATSADQAAEAAEDTEDSAEEPQPLERVLALSFEECVAALLALAADASVPETATLLGIPAATVTSRLAMAKKRVKQRAWRGARDALAAVRPSASPAFADEVLALVTRA